MSKTEIAASIPRAPRYPLRRLRLHRGMKQSHLAELLGVAQTTVSRWETGMLEMPPPFIAAAQRLLAMPPGPTQDSALRRLVEASSLKVHLICDRTHRLLAASHPRQADWSADTTDLTGKSMLVYASPEILAAESGLDAMGWHEGGAASLVVETGANTSSVVPILPSRILWERVTLEDGTAGRVVTTLE
ncbi:helix-turn-helix domain-containing protein [Nisaea acidiphila]|uniref:Helix-turn-helix domain-containing protein n=1 Tax=Nisaea acidiphila TaxID=1862145 RepID=A0A9J7AMQ7_9PROT|nr:helix-turn-helix transcriptional regulator [Nisaea acidiphila]UUX48931.1 helix-turn-helix domain-containing protein [Nisaea acidiphila]